MQAAKDVGVPNVYVHCFGDGRDTDPKSGAGYFQELLDKMKSIGTGQIGTIVGRYYAMDRDKRWERNELAMKALVLGEGEETDDPIKVVKERYEKGEGDEFLKPIIVGGKDARIQGNYAPTPMCLVRANLRQMAILSSSSTTDRIEFAK